MKIRTGFVSNSSSSSFVLIGKELSWDEIEKLTKTDIEQGVIITYDDTTEGGEVIADIQNEDMLKVSKDFRKLFTYYKDYSFYGEQQAEVGIKITADMVGKKIIGGMCSHHAPDSASMLLEDISYKHPEEHEAYMREKNNGQQD